MFFRRIENTKKEADVPTDPISAGIKEVKEQLQKIKCYEVSLDLAYLGYSFHNGEYSEDSEGDRGEHDIRIIGTSGEEFVAYLLNKAITRFAFDYECKHRRPFEDNRRQVNEIMEKCYSYLSCDYKWNKMTNLNDTIHIYLDLLDYYQKVSKEYLYNHDISGELKHRIRYIANYEYAEKSHGMWDVAFSIALVRYQINKIIDMAPELEEKYRKYENQYERLKVLKDQAPRNTPKYHLETWNEDILFKAELHINELIGGNYNTLRKEADTEVEKCVCHWMLCRVHAGRNLKQDMEILINIVDILLAGGYDTAVQELLVTDKYGVFPGYKPELYEIRQQALERLNTLNTGDKGYGGSR